MLEAVNNVSGIAAPEYIVVLGGVNDLIQLISPSGGLDSLARVSLGTSRRAARLLMTTE